MRCRPATDDDLVAIRALRWAWLEEDAGAPVSDDGYDEAWAAWWAVESGHRRFWVAEVDGEVVGMLSIVTMRRMPQPGRPQSAWGYVQQMYGLAEHRDAGVGSALLRAAIDATRVEGFWHLLVHPTDRALPFYERHGFRPADFVYTLPL